MLASILWMLIDARRCPIEPSGHTVEKRSFIGEPLIQRADHNVESLRKRLQEYHAQTEPILWRRVHLRWDPADFGAGEGHGCVVGSRGGECDEGGGVQRAGRGADVADLRALGPEGFASLLPCAVQPT